MKNLFVLPLILGLFILSCTTANNPTYQLTTTVSPSEGGTISPSSGTYSEGELVSLTATPSNGWRFVRWEGDWSGAVNPVNIGMNKNYNVVGIFEKRNYPLTINIDGYGEVEERVIQQKTTEYPYQTVVELTPVPDEGWRFVQWSGDLSGSDVPKTITVDGEKTVTAKFERKNYPLTINIVGEGTVKETVLPQRTTQYPFETAVILESIPSEGWEFVSWGGDLNGNENPQMIVVDEDKTVTATFQLKTYPLNVMVEGSGTVSIEPNQELYQHGSTVTLTPNPAEGWEFVEWGGDVSGDTVPLEVIITNELNIVGVFGRKDYPLTVNVVGEGTVRETIIPQRTTDYPYETVVELTPVPSEGWEFVSWGGDLNGNENPQMIVVDEDKTVTATFQLKTYPLNVMVEGSGTVSIEPNQELYQHGSTVTLTPNPAEGWEFDKWIGDFSGNLNPALVLINKHRSITARFVDGVPILLTNEPDNIEPFRVRVRGQIIDNRGAEIISRGICYSSTQNPTIDDNYIQIQGNFNNFQAEISGLEQNTIYYVRTCVLSVFDITGLTSYHYGNEVLFSTTSLIFTHGEGLTDIDGNNYKSVIIRNQEWMAENLKTTRYSNGNSIPNLSSNQIWSTTTIGGWSSYGNQVSNSNNYGHLYNWYAASDERNICPIGWRVPTKHDWEVLLEYLGGVSVSGGRLKITGTEFWEQPNMGATNESGFSAKGAGLRYDDGRFSYLKEYTYWWTSTQATSIASWRSGIQNGKFSDFGDGVMRDGYSIRCIRNP